MPTIKTKTAPRMPTDELRARAEIAQRALADVQALMDAADPVGAPEDFKEREKKAFAILEEVTALLPLSAPLTDAERERLEQEAEDMPDDGSIREMLAVFKKIAEDPATPPDVLAEIAKIDIDDSLAALDQVALIAPVARGAQALADALSAPAPRDPRAIALRKEAEKLAAKRRS